MPKNLSIGDLEQISTEIRKGIVRSIYLAGSGHPGGALGFADVLTALYFNIMNIDPTQPDMEQRDRFVLSNAHLVPGLYSTLAHRGFFPEEELDTLRKNESRLQGHTYRNLEIGVETTGGSLGQGLSVAIGFALASRMRGDTISTSKNPPFYTYCAVGDGELQEGQIWEALMFAGRERFGNLTIIIDRNRIQLSNDTRDIMPLESLRAKLEAFNLRVTEVDGHSLPEIIFALEKARMSTGATNVIIANTIPGKGVSFMEGKWEWHGKAPNKEEYEQAIKELS